MDGAVDLSLMGGSVPARALPPLDVTEPYWKVTKKAVLQRRNYSARCVGCELLWGG